MKKKIWPKVVSCLLCTTLALQTGFFAVGAAADEHTISMYYDGFSAAHDYTFTNPVDGQTITYPAGKDLTRLWFRAIDVPAYCIEPGVRIGYGTTYGSGDTDYWRKLGYAKRRAISWALLYGFPNSNYLTDRSLGYALTQIVIWEYILGYRDAYTNVCANRDLINNLSVPRAYQGIYMNYYDYLDNSLMKNKIIPSFFSDSQRTAPTYTLKYNPNAGDYETVLHDTNDLATLRDFNLSADGITFQVLDDKTLKVSTRDTIDETAPVTVRSLKNIPTSSSSAIIVWSASGMQEILTGGQRLDPPSAYMRLQTESAGDLNIRKHSEDGIVSDRTFRITGNGIDKTATTDSSGNVTIPNLIAGAYDVQEVNTPEPYNQPAAQTVVVLPGRTATVEFTNSLKKGRVRLVKQDSYSGGYLSGAVYRIYKPDGTVVTDLKSDAGQWVYSPYLTYGDYYIQEITPPVGFATDNSRHPFSVTENEQIIPKTMENMPLSDVYPVFIKPNAKYRGGTEVIASYMIHNHSYAEHASDHPLTVHFSASCSSKAGGKTTIIEQTNRVVVPRNDENLTWFKLKIPADTANVFFTCTVDTPAGVVETNTENNTDNQAIDVSAYQDSQTPNTKFENTPAGFHKPDEDADVPTGDYASNVTPSAAWQQWTCENGAWSKKTYGMTLTADQQIKPDANAFSSFLSGLFWHMKSGYGLSLTANTGAAQYESTILPGTDAYVLPQNGNAYFPEFGYMLAESEYRSLQLTAQNKLEFEQNPNSMTVFGKPDGRRIHFTPLWYPDGNYTVKTYLYDCWTPAGMIGLKNTLDPIVIKSNMYTDWFINHGNPG